MKFKIIVIDNFDSFVHLLAEEFRKRHCEVLIYRNTTTLAEMLKIINEQKPDGLVFSPGPGKPEEARLCLELLTHADEQLPILGVCLGHQCMVHYYDGKVTRAKEILHGKTSNLTHDNNSIFHNLPNPMAVGRYHSLLATQVIAPLKVIAYCHDEIMAVQHETLPRIGVQFHPESILSPFGGELINNFIQSLRG